MKCIINKVPKETLQTLELSINEATIPTDTDEEVNLRYTLKKIDDSIFINFRSILGQKKFVVSHKKARQTLRSVYDFYQGGSTTLIEFKKSLSDLIPILHKEIDINKGKLGEYAHNLYKELINKLGKQKLQSFGVEDQYLSVVLRSSE